MEMGREDYNAYHGGKGDDDDHSLTMPENSNEVDDADFIVSGFCFVHY
jgi:hypothetical protein